MSGLVCSKFQCQIFKPTGGIKGIRTSVFLAKFFKLFGAHQERPRHQVIAEIIGVSKIIHRDCPFNFVIDFQFIKSLIGLSLVKTGVNYK